MKNDSYFEHFAKFRHEAERSEALSPDILRAMPPDEILRMVQELHVHQIKLEMQNENLRTVYAQLDEARERYSDLYDFAPVGYLTLSEKGLILEANLTAG
ncbi:MAG: hypothetical protein MUC65_05660, partial [Pontiellaceae bacterium]|nr:hypothetical protein [Pontiellaceae bacterium]